jgi:hypothetical protein
MLSSLLYFDPYLSGEVKADLRSIASKCKLRTVAALIWTESGALAVASCVPAPKKTRLSPAARARYLAASVRAHLERRGLNARSKQITAVEKRIKGDCRVRSASR